MFIIVSIGLQRTRFDLLKHLHFSTIELIFFFVKQHNHSMWKTANSCMWRQSNGKQVCSKSKKFIFDNVSKITKLFGIIGLITLHDEKMFTSKAHQTQVLSKCLILEKCGIWTKLKIYLLKQNENQALWCTHEDFGEQFSFW